MAELIKDKRCENCGGSEVYFCDNMLTDFLCDSCGETNLIVTLPKLGADIPCKRMAGHSFRLSKADMIFCPYCWTEFGTLVR